jgi:hypothetical protein
LDLSSHLDTLVKAITRLKEISSSVNDYIDIFISLVNLSLFKGQIDKEKSESYLNILQAKRKVDTEANITLLNTYNVKNIDRNDLLIERLVII